MFKFRVQSLIQNFFYFKNFIWKICCVAIVNQSLWAILWKSDAPGMSNQKWSHWLSSWLSIHHICVRCNKNLVGMAPTWRSMMRLMVMMVVATVAVAVILWPFSLTTLVVDFGTSSWDFPMVENYPIEPPQCDCLPWDWNWNGGLKNWFVWNFGLVEVFIKSLWKLSFHIQRSTLWKHVCHLWKARNGITSCHDGQQNTYGIWGLFSHG